VCVTKRIPAHPEITQQLLDHQVEQLAIAGAAEVVAPVLGVGLEDARAADVRLAHREFARVEKERRDNLVVDLHEAHRTALLGVRLEDLGRVRSL